MKLSQMRKFDQLSFMDFPEEYMWRMIDDLFDTPKDLYEAVDFFISHLPPNHDMDGKEWIKLINIADDVKRRRSSTQKQRRFVGLIIACNWTKMIQTAEFSLL